jgi:hypothetical protein
MKRRYILGTVAGVVVAGGLLAGGIGWVSAQTPPGAGTPVPVTSGPRMHASGGFGAMGTQHAQMQDTLAKSLGLTAEQLQAEFQSGKTVPQIAQERGIDLTELQSTMQAQHQANGFPGMAAHGQMGMSQGQATIAEALGLTVEELQQQLQAGKTVLQLAQEKGVDLTKIHEGMMASH